MLRLNFFGAVTRFGRVERKWLGRRLAIGLVATVHAAPVLAEPASTRADDTRNHRLALHLGLGAPLGVLGGAYTYSTGGVFQLETGVGYGFTGLHLSVMPMLAWGERHRFTTGAGLGWAVLPENCGRDPEITPSGELREPSAPCLWINIDAAGYEFVSAGGVSFVVAGGVTLPTQPVHHGRFFGIEPFTPMPHVRIAVGAWLDGPSAPDEPRDRRATPAAPHARRHRMSAHARRHRMSGEGGGGVFPYVGHFALAYTFAAWPWLRVQGAYGLHGPSSMVQLALGSRNHRYVASAGAAWLHRYDEAPCDSDCVVLGADVAGYEVVLDDGFTAFVGAGLSLLARPVEVDPRLEPSRREAVHLRGGVGWWL